MSLVSKYAVPFSNRQAATIDNVINKLVQGGIGYLKIELPVNPSVNNCIGFKIKVTSEDTKELLFEGHISGSSSDGYNWIYVSASETGGINVGNPILFCYKSVDSTILKSILIGSESTDWGSLVMVNIEYIQATLSTAPDGEEGIVSTESINEYATTAVTLDETTGKLSDGWNFSIGQITDETIAMSAVKVAKTDAVSIIVEGVVNGIAREDESGNVVIDTEFNGGCINLYDENSDTYGVIVADGSKLVNLENNEELKSMTFTSTGFRDPIVVESATNSDVNFGFTIKEAGKTVNPKVKIDKFVLGEWLPDNTKKLSIKTSTNLNAKSTLLEPGGLGLINDSKMNTDLYVGIGTDNKLVGRATICKNDGEFRSVDKVDGKLVAYEGKLYICNGGEYQPIKYSAQISLDEIKNGYFYERVNAEAQLGGEIVRLKYDDGLILSNEIHAHMVDDVIHVTNADRNRWDNKLDETECYSKDYIDKELLELGKTYKKGYHEPVEEMLPGDTDFTTHNYPYGHRILVREYMDVQPHIKIAGDRNEWLESEPFDLGHRVICISDYNEYMNVNNKLAKTSFSWSYLD